MIVTLIVSLRGPGSPRVFTLRSQQCAVFPASLPLNHSTYCILVSLRPFYRLFYFAFRKIRSVNKINCSAFLTVIYSFYRFQLYTIIFLYGKIRLFLLLLLAGMTGRAKLLDSRWSLSPEYSVSGRE